MSELLKHPERYYNSENENMRRNGERVWIAWTNKEIYNAQGNLCAILSIGIDRTEQKKTAEILAEQERENIASAERTRLARDLHDAVSQTLFSASIIAEVLPRIWAKDPDEGNRRLEEIRQLTRGALAEMRTLLFELRPSALSDAELGYLLHQLAESVTGRSRIPVDVNIEGQCDLTPEVKVALYRITQEALNNVAKHASANKANVVLSCHSGVVELSISDNGKGFDVASVHPDSLGLGIMRDRAREIGAEIIVQSIIGAGSQIVVRLKDTREEVR
jgi:signal transduction histidine kinase